MSTRGPVLLVHGFFHGAWCWSEVTLELAARGVSSVAVDLAGHGLRARRPAALSSRPYDATTFATELSPVAGVDLDQASLLLIEQVRRAGRGQPVTVVAHSMGGPVLSRAAEREPALFTRLVYLTAYMPASDVPCIAYLQAPEADGEQISALLTADPVTVGALRVDTATDETWPAIRATFYSDVAPETADAAIALLGCDAPTAMALQPITLTNKGWGSMARTYVTCEQDHTIPLALQRLFISQADTAFPDTKTDVMTLDSSHSPFLSMPDRVAEIIAGMV